MTIIFEDYREREKFVWALLDNDREVLRKLYNEALKKLKDQDEEYGDYGKAQYW